MRGRRGQSSSSSVTQERTRMALRKQMIKDTSDIPSENTQEEDEDKKDELSESLLSLPSVRHKRRRERENKPKAKEMTEEEMVDLAMRLSEQEASNTALRLQQEEEAMMKAIHESMVGQSQPCPASQSQSLLAVADASLRLCSRRKLSYANGRTASSVDRGAAADLCAPETDLNREAKGTGGETINRNKKRKRKEGSPQPEMPDSSQTQKICSQGSPSSSESLLALPDSPQSSDSTQIDDCQLRRSPVFPLTGCRPQVHVSRLSRDLLETCRASGFVSYSQDSWASTQKSPSARPKSPTFPRSADDFTAPPQSPVLSETERSPVFGRNAPSASNPPACENSGFTFSSQGSLTSTARSASCRPHSPVFPRSPPPPKKLAICKSPVFSEAERGPGETSRGFSTTSRRHQTHLDAQDESAVPPAAELRGSNREVDPPQSPRQDNVNDLSPDVRLNEVAVSSKSDDAEASTKTWNSSEAELTSDMTLLWSDEDEDVTPVGSPSPVFPEERAVGRAAASQNHMTAASPRSNRVNRVIPFRPALQADRRTSPKPSCSSTAARRQQLSTAEQELPVSGEGAVNRASAPCKQPAGEPTVHYYWGVPFCPRGLDPDAYTQVILAQMEVYDRSLKQAQRRLLRKATWGEPILPQTEKSPSPESPAESPERLVPPRRGLRLRGRRVSEAGEAEEEEDDGKDAEEEEDREGEKKEGGGGEGEEGQADDCEVCPETQLSNDDERTQDLMVDADAGAEVRPESPDLHEVEMIPRDERPAGAEPREEELEEMEVDASVDGDMRGHVPVSGGDVGGRRVTEEEQAQEEVAEGSGPQRPESPEPELEPTAIPRGPKTNVDCPICQGSFPAAKIELHAAYCDGEVAVVEERRPGAQNFQASPKLRRKKTRRAEATAEETNDDGGNQQKCYICHRAVPLRDYSRHTELCFLRRPSQAETRGNLLSALEQTENRDSEAGPSGSRLQPREVIDLRDDDDDDEEEGGGGSVFTISNSPIRSFTPISEASDCLVDFRRQQRAKKPSQRRR